ncbi:MAG: oligosaccharide flippase family protein [Ignavibacteriae bacterium]|nr:oligosaccharide flippase family protein [Ignavibacteriota bacterium]
MFKKILNTYFAKNSFAGNVATLTTGTVIAQVFSGLLSPVLSRLYSPDDYGLFALFTSVLSILVVIAPLRYEMAIMLPKENKDSAKIVNLSFLFLSITTTLVLFLVLFFNKSISIALGNYLISPWLIFIPLALLLTCSSQAINYLVISYSKVVQSVFTSLTSLGFGFMKFAVAGLIYSSIIGQFFSLSVLLKKIKLKFFINKENLEYSELKAKAKEYKQFPLYTLPTAILDVFSLQLPIILISHFFGTTEVGYYSFSYRILSLPIILIGTSISQVFYQKVSVRYNEGGDTRSLIKKTWLHLAYMGILPLVITLFFGPEIFSFVFGEKWVMAGKLSSVLSPMLFAMFVGSPTSSAYLVYKMQRLGLVFGIIVLLYRPIALFIGYYLSDFMLGIKILVLLEVVQIFFYNLFLWRKIGKVHNIRE